MSLTRRILAGSAQLTLANALARALGIVSMPLLTHLLSPAAYGQAALASTLISLISVIGLMGMDMSYARNYFSSAAPSGMAVETFCWRFALLAALLAGGFAALVWLFHAWRDRMAIEVLAWWVFAGTAMSSLMAMAQTRSRLHERHGRLSIAVAAGGVSATVLALLLSWSAMPDERALVSGYVAAYAVPVAIMGIPVWRQLSSSSGLDADSRWQVFAVGAPGIVTAPMYWILSSSDRWFLQSYSDPTTVGLYAVACTFGQLGMMVNSALLAIWLPEATRLHESGVANSDHMLAAIMVRLLLMMALVWLGVGILGGDLLLWLVAEKFHSAAKVVPWLASGVFFYGCYHLANTGLFLGRSLKWSALLWTGVGVVSMVGNAVLIPFYGVMAAAFVQFGSFALLAFVVLFMAQKRHPLPLPYGRLVLALAVTVSALMLGQLLPAAVGMGTLLCKLGLLCAAAITVLSAVDRELLLQGMNRFRMWYVNRGVRQ